MRIAFLQREWFENIGIMTLAAVLTKAGHQLEVFLGSAEQDIVKAVKKFHPRLTCFSCTTGEHVWALETARRLKTQTKTLNVFGGHHPTFFPQIIREPAVDIVCRGEGEFALRDLTQALERQQPIEHIPNLWVKLNDHIYENNLRPLIEDLDSLPLPLRKIYDKYPALQKNDTKHFMASRGCPCNCSYCYAHAMRALYRGKGTFVRFRSPQHIIREIRQAKREYRLKTVFLDDDILTFNKPWLYDFLNQYQNTIDVPFICNVWAAGLDAETCRRLAAAGCFRVSMGVETGDEELRRRVLNKNISDQQIVEAAANLHRNGIKILTNNMLGLPGETIGQALKTIALNTQIGTEYPWCSILQPYPGTAIEQKLMETGTLDQTTEASFSSTFFKASPLRQGNIPQLIRLQKFFFLAVKFPFLVPVIRLLIKLPLDPLYEIIFLVSFAHRYRVANRLSWAEMLKFSLKNLSLYRKNV